MFCIASGLEVLCCAVLRHANRFASEPFYSWSFLCENDESIQDSNDLWLHPSTSINSATSPDVALVVAGFEPK